MLYWGVFSANVNSRSHSLLCCRSSICRLPVCRSCALLSRSKFSAMFLCQLAIRWHPRKYRVIITNLSGEKIANVNFCTTTTYIIHVEASAYAHWTDYKYLWLEGTILGYKKLELRTICASLILLGLLTFGTVYLTMLSCLIQLTCLSPGLINFGNIKMLFMILKPKFMEPEVGVVTRY